MFITYNYFREFFKQNLVENKAVLKINILV